jgi:hypothetical protein
LESGLKFCYTTKKSLISIKFKIISAHRAKIKFIAPASSSGNDEIRFEQ